MEGARSSLRAPLKHTQALGKRFPPPFCRFSPCKGRALAGGILLLNLQGIEVVCRERIDSTPAASDAGHDRTPEGATPPHASLALFKFQRMRSMPAALLLRKHGASSLRTSPVWLSRRGAIPENRPACRSNAPTEPTGANPFCLIIPRARGE